MTRHHTERQEGNKLNRCGALGLLETGSPCKRYVCPRPPCFPASRSAIKPFLLLLTLPCSHDSKVELHNRDHQKVQTEKMGSRMERHSGA